MCPELIRAEGEKMNVIFKKNSTSRSRNKSPVYNVSAAYGSTDNRNRMHPSLERH